jgi:hypothetical protein
MWTRGHDHCDVVIWYAFRRGTLLSLWLVDDDDDDDDDDHRVWNHNGLSNSLFYIWHTLLYIIYLCILYLLIYMYIIFIYL